MAPPALPEKKAILLFTAAIHRLMQDNFPANRNGFLIRIPIEPGAVSSQLPQAGKTKGDEIIQTLLFPDHG